MTRRKLETIWRPSLLIGGVLNASCVFLLGGYDQPSTKGVAAVAFVLLGIGLVGAALSLKRNSR